MLIVIDKNIPFVGQIFEPFFEVKYLPYQEINQAAVRQADVLLIRTRTHCNQALLQDSNIKLIVSATIGTDHLDTQYLESAGITWRNVPGCNATAVVQYVFTALSVFSTKTAQPLDGKVLGVVGVGNIGRKVVEGAEKLGMKVLCCDPLRQQQENLPHFVDLQTIAENADIVTLHTSYTQHGNFPTYHLLNQDFFNRCKTNLWLVNTSRGEVIDEVALLKALSDNSKIAQIALDVWEGEPQITHQNLPYLVNIATPHIAGYSLRGKINASRQAVQQIADFHQLPLQFTTPHLPVVTMSNDCCGMSNEETVKKIILQTYDIEQETRQFLEDITLAEKIRSEYQYRLSFEDFIIKTADNQQLSEQLTTLGFQIDNG